MGLKNDILASMSDEKLIDIHLVGTDGVEVPCSKFVLAARSEVFKKMFRSGFREQHDDRSNLAYSSTVIQIVVNYCYSDEVKMELILDNEEWTDQKVGMLVQLRDAARYYALDRVRQTVETQIGELVFQNKAGVEYVCSILAATMVDAGQDEQDGAFWESLFQFVVTKPVECLHLDQDSFDCHPRLLARVLDRVNDTFVVARSLYAWSVQECKDSAACEDKDREVLLALAKRVDLKQLSTNQLSKIGDCLAFSKDRMLEAYIHHGRHSQVQPPGMPSFPSRKVVVNVAGAGVADLNGLYEQFDLSGQVFVKTGIHGGVQCEFEIKWHQTKNKWKISVLPKTLGGTPLRMYEARKNSMNELAKANQIPFNHWMCLEGAKPAPYVAIIQPPEQKQQPFQFTFEKSTIGIPQQFSPPTAPRQLRRVRSQGRSRVR